MYIVRVYKDYNTNKMLGAKVVDENSLDFKEVDWDSITNTIKINPSLIVNAELDHNGKAKLKNMNPKVRIKYFNQVYSGDFVIKQYCIITGNNTGKVDFIADSADGIHSGNNVSIGDIALVLGIGDITKLRMYNAYIEKVNNKCSVFVFNGSNYRKLQSLVVTNVKNIIDKCWDYDLVGVSQEGLRIMNLEHIDNAGQATIPNVISHLENFLGGVNNVIIPLGVRSLGNKCFEDLDDLISVNIKGNIPIIPNRCFADSTIRQIRFSGSEEEIGDSAFEGSLLRCGVYTRAKIIGVRAFGSTGITKVVLHNTEEIKVCAFEYCDKLTVVKLGESVKKIGGGAFRFCSKLQEVEIPDTVEYIGKQAFYGCNKLKEVKLPKSVRIDIDAFPRKCKIHYY